MEQALKIAVERAGGPARLAKVLGGITPQAISQWKVCPVGRALALERATGVSRHELRPDIYGPPPSGFPAPTAPNPMALPA